VLEAVGIYLAYGRLGEAAGLLRDALHKEPERTDIGLQLLEVLGRQGDSAAYDNRKVICVSRVWIPRIAGCSRPTPETCHRVPPYWPLCRRLWRPSCCAHLRREADFELNLGELSMDSSWDLEDSRSDTPEPPADTSALGAGLQVLPQDFELPQASSEDPELEWIPEPDAEPLDDDFLNEFADAEPSLVLQPLDLQEPEPVHDENSGKLEQAQTCIDDGDIDSAIALLNELLKDGDEPLKQTARTLLAGIR
jgi:FimV-like protein